MNNKILIGLLLCLLFVPIRYYALESAPPGFYVDEAGAAAHVVCLKENLRNCKGDFLPLFSQTWGEGRVGPVYQYSGLLWSAVFGDTIYSLRAMTVTVTLMAIPLILYVVYAIEAGGSVVLWVLLSCFLSPWVFHSSRISWDPPLVAFFFVLGLVFVLIGQKRQRSSFFVLSALATLVASLAYPPVLAHSFFFYLFLFSWWFLYKRELHLKHIAVFGGSFLAAFFIVLLTDVSTIVNRAGTVSIFSDDPRNPTAGGPLLDKMIQFGANVLLHFDPSYLFLKGDFNLRHTVTNFGLASWPAGIAIVCALVLLLWYGVVRFGRGTINPQKKELLIIAFMGYLSAAMAASLTWDSLPHGLRSLSGWPFLCMISGLALERISRTGVVLVLVIASALAYSYHFYDHYFHHFPKQAVWWFDKDVTDAYSEANGEREEWERLMEKRQYPSLARTYYRIAYFDDVHPIEKD